MAIRTATLRQQPQLRWREIVAERIAGLGLALRREPSEPREPMRSHSFKDSPDFWLRHVQGR